MRRCLVLLVLAAALPAGCGDSAPSSTPLHVACRGTGRPAVVLEAGADSPLGVWSLVQRPASSFTRVCSYDRAGVGRSPAAAGDELRTARDSTADLARVVEAEGIQPPYVLVGHSWGGALARLYAGEHRHDLAGLVLVEATTPEFFETQQLDVTGTPPFERLDLSASLDEIEEVRDLAHTRLVALTRGENNVLGVSPEVKRRFEAAWLRTQKGLARLSDDRVHAIAPESDHLIPSATGQPELIVAALRAIVDAERAGTQLPSCRAVFRGLRARCLD
jgi:pimeloyl-ACP methyl ester carboxylesterase